MSNRWRKIAIKLIRSLPARIQSNKKVLRSTTDRMHSTRVCSDAARGFIHFTDKRIRGTIEAIERELMREDCASVSDRRDRRGRLPGRDVYFCLLIWRASCLHRVWPKKSARELFGLLSVRNDLGLRVGRYDPETNGQLGNFSGISHYRYTAALVLSDQDRSMARLPRMRHAPAQPMKSFSLRRS